METNPRLRPPRPPRPPRPRRIAVLTELLTNDFESVLGEVIDSARPHGIEVIAFSHGVHEWPTSRNLVTDLPGPACVDGVLLVSLGDVVPVRELVTYCERYRPLPICSMTVPWTEHPCVLIDDEPGMREAIRHLVRVHGRRRIAFVRGPDVSAEARLRFRVYGEVLAEHGLEVDPRLVSAPGRFTRTSGRDHVRDLVGHAVAFDAVACVNDGAALGALRELAACGVRVPGDVSVVGFDDLDVSRYLESPLTTVRRPIRAQAREAFAVLLSQMTGEPRPAPAPLRTELVIRKSCGCSPYALRVQPGEEDRTPASVDDLRRPGAGGAIAVAAAAGTLGAALARELYDALLADLSSGATSFLDTLERALHGGALLRGESARLHEWITVVERAVADRLDDGTTAWRRADAALHGARVRVSNASERIPAKAQLRIEERCQRLGSVTRAFAGVQSIPAIVAVLAERLPALGVSSCYVCLYEGSAVPAEWARLVLAWDGRRGPLAVPSEGVRFCCRDFLPGSVFADDDAHAFVAYVTCPLELEVASPGYVVWGEHLREGRGRGSGDGRRGERGERDRRDGFVFESLRVQIAAAFRELQLIQPLVDETRRREAAERAHLERDVRVARRIRTDLVPRLVHVDGLAIAVRSVSSSELGGAYHDVIPVEGGCWIGTGRVTGRGLPTGLVMLMLQSVVSGLTRSSPGAAPSDLADLVQTVLLENTWRRTDQPERATLTLLRYRTDGSVALSGEHARISICRARTGQVEALGSPDGDAAYELAPGDVFVLHGATACGDPARAERDPDLDAGLAAVLARVRRESVDAIADALVTEAHGRTMTTPAPSGDLTLIVGRHIGSRPGGGPSS
jgi:sigma-B regulation protein RsbU (phosphoserine phosphatase)